MCRSATQLVLTFVTGVYIFALEYNLTQENVRIPDGNKEKKVYSGNERNNFKWDKEVKDYVDKFKSSGY
eukprot:snap_masked-scaffold_122-processed-gene-0.6-mRNA-1 protein AED:0.32 eAED:0.32 QI:0/0/0/1/1/1/2/0/68